MHFTSFEEAAILKRSDLSLPDSLLVEIKTRYSESSRHYHDWNHALSVLSWVNHVCDVFPVDKLADYEDAHWQMRLAALFHDVIYSVHQGTPKNEELSAEFLLTMIGVKPYDRNPVLPNYGPGVDVSGAFNLIMTTAQHGKLEANDVPLATALFMDCDIASFGEPRWEIVVWNDNNVTAELLQRYTPEEVSVGRKKFLSGLLAKRSIFLSDYFRVRFEDQARRNIARLLDSL